MRVPAQIVGCGLVTPLGSTLDETWKNILAGQCISDHSAVGGFTGPSRFDNLALAAATQALDDAQWQGGDAPIALILATSKGPIDQWTPGPESSPEVFSRRASSPDSPLVRKNGRDFGISVSANRLARSLFEQRQLKCTPSLVVCAACASGPIGLIRATLMLQAGEATRILVVAAEASVTPLFLASFRRLGILAPPEIGCRPFDEHRAGFFMSEAAAAICLEGGLCNKSRYPRITGIAHGAFATGLISLDSDNQTLPTLLKRALDGTTPDLIHCHGTATPANDPMEIAAIESVLTFPSTGISPSPGTPGEGRGEGKYEGPMPPIIYSHKAALGHSQGAAGLISVVLNSQMHATGIIPGNVRTTAPIPTTRVIIPREIQRKPIRQSAILASGFGGPVAAVVLS